MSAEVSPWFRELSENPRLLSLEGAGSRGKSFVHYDPDNSRLDLKYFWDPETQRLLAPIWFGTEAEGPPNCAHGGSVAAVLDDAMGTSAWAAGYRVVAVNLNIDYRHFVTLERTYRMIADVRDVAGRKVYTYGRITEDKPDGKLLAEGAGIFLQIDFEKMLTRDPEGPVA